MRNQAVLRVYEITDFGRRGRLRGVLHVHRRGRPPNARYKIRWAGHKEWHAMEGEQVERMLNDKRARDIIALYNSVGERIR